MKFYLAANPGKGFVDAEYVRRAMDYIRASGHTITHDWLSARDSKGRMMAAIDDLDGVRACDGLILLDNPAGGKGMYAELGAALALGKPCAVVAPQGSMLFFDHPLVTRVDTLAMALVALDRDGT